MVDIQPKTKYSDIYSLQKKLSKKLDEKRFVHTLGVSFTASALAMRYGADIHKAQIAGLLHDCAKYMTAEEMLEMAMKHNIPVTEMEREKPDLLHAKLGSFLAMKKYHIQDTEINEAIISHTTGKPAMSLLDKIIYIADYIEPGRKMIPGLKEARIRAFKDLDDSLVFIIKGILDYLKGKNDAIDRETIDTYNYYLNLEHENENN